MSPVAVLLALAPLIGSAGAAGDPVAATQAALRTAQSRAARQARPAPIPREAYLRRPAIGDVLLSPDGSCVSFLERSERGFDLMLQQVASGDRTRVIAGMQRAETAWSGDGRRLWVADEQGLAVIEEPGPSKRRVLKWDARRSQRFWAVDARAPAFAIVHERVVQLGSRLHRYLAVDARGQTRLLHESAWPLRDALLNADGSLAFTAAFDGPEHEIVIRQYGADGPRELLRRGYLEAGVLVGFNEAQRTLWSVSHEGEDKLALRRWRQESGTWETVNRDPEGVADADAWIWSSAREDWLAIAYHGARRRWHGNDDGTSALLGALARRFPEANLSLSTTTDGRLWLVQAQQADRALDRHYLYRPESDRLQPLFALEETTAQDGPPPGTAMHAVDYRASDGMLLHGYVLLPSGIDSDKAPLIAWLHGGPVARVFDRYEASMQLLANRGCAVFVPNFRASTGYGLDYVRSAGGDVGNGRVLADIVDGLDFLLAQGIGDRDRQAVMGVSFGGYASLLAVSHHPARFRFAFAAAPPTDYGWIKQWQAEHDSDAMRSEPIPLSLQFTRLGFAYEDLGWREKMQRESPLAALPALQAPVYIWAGERDDRVPLKSIVHYVGEARRLGKQLGLLIDPSGGHSPETPLGAQAGLYLVELAAHRHLGIDLSPVSPQLRTFLRDNVRIDLDAQR